MSVLSPDRLADVVREHPGWQLVDGCLVRTVEAESFLTGIALVVAVARVAEEADHHPDVDVRYTAVTFRLSTHSEGGVTEADVALAEQVDALVLEHRPA